MTFAPRLFVAAVSLSLLACSKPELPRSGVSNDVRKTEAAGVSTVVGAARSSAHDNRAAERLDCGNDHFRFAESLRQLPVGMPGVLSGGQSLADHGEHFNVTDEPQYASAPFRRFAAAAIGENRIFAVVEHGGLGYGVEYWAFERKGSQWVGNERWFGDVPSSLPALLSVTCLAKGEVTMSKACPQPDYPPAAMRAKAQGTTTVALTIDETGHVSDGQVVNTSGASRAHHLLDRAIVESSRACKFAPATEPGLRHTTFSYTWMLE